MKIGDKAPDFELTDQHDRNVRMSDAIGKGGLVVFFYPKDGTPICTLEACSFRDNYHAFVEYAVNVVGISSDTVQSHHAFAEKHSLPFPLLWDKDGKIRKLWGVPSTLGVLPGRTTYVLDASGVVRSIFSSQLEADRHVATALEAVKKMHNSPLDGGAAHA